MPEYSESSALLEKSLREIPCWKRYSKAWCIAGLAVFFVALTLFVGIGEWKALDAGQSMTCSKGGVMGVLHLQQESPSELLGKHKYSKSETNKVPSAVIFSGNGRHAVLLDETKRFLFNKSWWRTVLPIRDQNGNEGKFDQDGMPAPRWKSVSVVASDSSLVIFGGHALSVDATPGNDVPNQETHLLRDDPIGAGFANDVWILKYYTPDAANLKEEKIIEPRPKWEHVVFHEDDDIPLPRRAHAAASIGDKMYVYGGKYCNITSIEPPVGVCQELGDLWAFDMIKLQWERLWEEESPVKSVGRHKTKNPEGRHGHTLVSASVRTKHSDESVDYVILYGGRDEVGYFNDVWAWNSVNGKWEDWTPDYEHTTLPVPPRRDHHMAASVDYYEDENPKMVIFGGRGAPESQESQHSSSMALNDLWEFDYVLKQWRKINPEGIKPGPRFLSAFTDYDGFEEIELNQNETTIEKTKRMLIFGGDANIEESGQNGPKRLNDMWEYNTKSQTWHILSRHNC